jgi:RNA polymerase sigma factor (sigma-70 family)
MRVDELIEGCKSGSRIHFTELYDRYAPAMYGICLRYSGSTAEAKDILQEGFIKVFLQLHTFDKTRAPFEVWLRKIFIYRSIDYLRHRKMALFYPVEFAELEIEEEEDDEYEMPLDFSMQELLDMVRELPTGYRTVFNLFAIEEKTHVEIAELLDISVNTSKSQYKKARRMLQEKIRSKMPMPKYKYKYGS